MYEESEVSIKELVQVLLNEKKLISMITLGISVIAIIVTLLLPKVYEAESQIVYSIPETDSSRFGTFIFPSQNVADYLPLLNSEDVKHEVALILDLESSSNVNIQVEFNKEYKYVTIKTTSNTPEKAKEINDVLAETYLNQIRAQYKFLAIDKFTSNHELNLSNLNYQIKKTQSMIDEKTKFLQELSPVYTLQKALFADPKTAALYADKFNLDLSKLSNDVILEEYVNEKYLEIESEIIDLRSSIINMNENYKFSELLLAELKSEKIMFQEQIKDLNYLDALNDELDILNGSINQVSEAPIPLTKISPKNAINVAIGFVLGLLTAIFIVFFKNYWLSDSK